MRRRTLGQHLRAVLLTTPLISAPACYGFGPCDPPPETNSFPLIQASDGGVQFVSCGVGPSPLLSGPDGGFDCEATCARWNDECTGNHFQRCSLQFQPDGGPGELTCVGFHPCTGGRRPVSLLAGGAAQSAHPVGVYFAHSARLEAASVPAFGMLARELADHRAPHWLIRVAQRSATDEVRHATATAALARRYGATPIRPSFGPTPTERSLESIATENAIEGCMRETYGALIALWQVRHAQDPVVAAAMGPIAADEIHHAELAWEVASWAEPRLTRAARCRVEAARAAALAALATEAGHPVKSGLVELAGLPPPEIAMALLSGLGRTVGCN
jgi:hypothetical protein